MKETSIEAYQSSHELRIKHHSIILNTMKVINTPLIAEDIAIYAGLEYNQVSRRMKELELQDKVICTQEKGLTSKGRKAFKWMMN